MRGGESSPHHAAQLYRQIAPAAPHPSGKDLCRINLTKIFAILNKVYKKLNQALNIENKALV
jgi:hypothetical protein